MTYEIFEGNMERLEKKLNTIYNKCRAYGCDFHYRQVGETFKELADGQGNMYTARFILVEAEGTAIINNWEFVASVEHTEKGNIFAGVPGIEIPKRYYDAKPVCEHCKSSRYRKYTYIVRNKETGEFKQVGKSCLRDFTHGMSAQMAAQYMSLFDTLVEGRSPEPGCRIRHYLRKEEYLPYVAETIRHFGYKKTDDYGEGTAAKALDYYNVVNGRIAQRQYRDYLWEEMDQVGFDAGSAETAQLVKDALGWIAGQDGNSTYIHNLKTACSLDYVPYKNYGLLASLFPAYERARRQMAKRQAAFDMEKGSRHVGNIKDKVTVKVRLVTCVTSWETQYGTTRIYKIIGMDGNVYTWKTAKIIGDVPGNMQITGTIKAHTEFRGIKQTELTRCQIA